MLEELIEDEGEKNQKNMIKIFKKTQLENIDADAARNKFNMVSFKKKNEQTEKLFTQMALNNKKALSMNCKLSYYNYLIIIFASKQQLKILT